MPVYNGMPLLKASIESIKRQTYTHWQCIICDDGSTDGTWEYLQTLFDPIEPLNRPQDIEPSEALEPRFVFLKNEKNKGRGFSRQRILEACTAPYICMLDAGDLMHPDRIKKQVEYLEQNKHVGLVSSAMMSFGLHTDKLLYRGRGEKGIIQYDGLNFPNFAASMFRNPQNTKTKFNIQLNFSEDQYFLDKYFRIHPKYYVQSEPLYYYSEFDSVSKSKIRTSYIQNIKIYAQQHKWTVSLTFVLKYIYSIIIFPFLCMETILMRRGRPATDQEREEFNKHARPMVERV